LHVDERLPVAVYLNRARRDCGLQYLPAQQFVVNRLAAREDGCLQDAEMIPGEKDCRLGNGID